MSYTPGVGKSKWKGKLSVLIAREREEARDLSLVARHVTTVDATALISRIIANKSATIDDLHELKDFQA